ncbi:MAG: hypothetical protein ACK5NG_04255 [Chthoniobacterales bacterium]
MLLMISLAGISGVYADGGLLVAKRQGELYDVSLFVGPSPLRAGPLEVSILLKERGRKEVLSDAKVFVKFRYLSSEEDEKKEGWKPLCCRIEQVNELELSREHAANRLLYGGWVSLEKSGLWQIELEVDGVSGREKFILPVELASPSSPIFSYWPFLMFPVFFSTLLVANRCSCRK